MSVELDNARHILLTGRPGIGKTTIVIKVCQLLTNVKVPTTGFYTKELRSGNSRIGFDVVSLNDEHGPLARIASGDRNLYGKQCAAPRVGNYEVDLTSFESVALPSLHLENNNSVVVIDEIGKMELFSKRFQNNVSTLFNVKDLIILATVPNRLHNTLIENLKRLPTSILIEVDLKNRDDLPNKIAESIKNTYHKKLTKL